MDKDSISSLELKWTKDKPTEPGYYWVRRHNDNETIEIGEVIFTAAGQFIRSFYTKDELFMMDSWYEYHVPDFCGPLHPPTFQEDDSPEHFGRWTTGSAKMEKTDENSWKEQSKYWKEAYYKEVKLRESFQYAEKADDKEYVHSFKYPGDLLPDNEILDAYKAGLRRAQGRVDALRLDRAIMRVDEDRVDYFNIYKDSYDVLFRYVLKNLRCSVRELNEALLIELGIDDNLWREIDK